MLEIKFLPSTEVADEIMEEPKFAGKFLPEWFKKIPTFLASDCELPILPNLHSNLTAKACIPFLDALTTGYMITLPCDVIATKDTRFPNRLMWDVSWTAITEHSRFQYRGLDIPPEYEPDAFKWETFFTVETPPGYSCFFMHPANRVELPFYTLSGVVDTDNYNLPVNLPFFLRKDFEGIIPKGTPIAQVIPIKRENWEGKREKFESKNKHWIDDLKTTIFRSYKNRFWSKKSYK